MKRSNLQKSEVDRIAMAITGAAIVMILWLIVLAAPDTHAAVFASIAPLAGRHVDEANTISAFDYFARFAAPDDEQRSRLPRFDLR